MMNAADGHGIVGREMLRLLAAIQYFTRLPAPGWVGHDQALLDDAVRYFPAVGLLVGSVGACVLIAADQFWKMPIAVVLSMIATIVLTGAFHEDGLADAADGLGGSSDRTRTLELMKDSRIGVFGAAALILALLLKFSALSGLPLARAAWLLIAGHAISRFGAVLIMATLPYVRDVDQSRSKPLVRQVSRTALILGAATSGVGLIPVQWRGLLGGVGVLGLCLGWRAYLQRRLGGYTGDCLGAAQQASESVFYLLCIGSV